MGILTFKIKKSKINYVTFCTFVKTNIFLLTMQTIQELFDGILSRNTRALSKGITLIESNLETDTIKANHLVELCLQIPSKSLRIGISGIPGVGKSTFIDTFGTYLCSNGYSVAVLAVDPTSSISKGSILGDKTRMSSLSQMQNCFIRPSPSGGSLGGVTKKMRETILLCEAAGYDYIFIETVGVGQNEITVRSMTDLFLLLMIAGAGDELQGFKRGITEISDIILVNKVDGEQRVTSLLTKAEYQRAVKFLTPSTPGWETLVQTFSSLDSSDCENLFHHITSFHTHILSTGLVSQRRRAQEIQWFDDLLHSVAFMYFFHSTSRIEFVSDLKKQISSGAINATIAINKVMNEMK